MKKAALALIVAIAVSGCTAQQLNDGTFAASLAFVALKAAGVPV